MSLSIKDLNESPGPHKALYLGDNPQINFSLDSSTFSSSILPSSTKAPHEPARAELKPGSARLEKNYASSSLMSRAKKNFGSTRSSRAKLGKIQARAELDLSWLELARALHIPTKK
jgi:hypothetical protein